MLFLSSSVSGKFSFTANQFWLGAITVLGEKGNNFPFRFDEAHQLVLPVTLFLSTK